MKFRTRLVVLLTSAMAVTVTASFGTVLYVVDRSEERQLDDALRKEARQEAAEIAALGAKSLRISDRGGPEADDVGRLTKFAVIYDGEGRPVDETPTFTKGVPPLAALQHPRGQPFDFDYGSESLRGVFVGVPGHLPTLLLLAAPKTDLDRDMRFLRDVMALAAISSLLLTAITTFAVVRRVTRGHEAIAATARNVAAGDLAARVRLSNGDDEVVQLARDVDEMVGRLAVLVEGQQRFVAHAAHELRSPLTALYGELQLALRRSRSAEEYRAAIEEALDSARRLKALAEDLLALARLGADHEPSYTPVSLDEVAGNARRWVEREAERRRVSIEVDTDGSVVLGNALDLERMLRNLLDNAVRHSPEDGSVRLHAVSEGDTVLVTVSDDGEGIPSADRQRIFEPFFRADAERRRDDGSGLGLAIVREIARVHGGDVTLEEGARGRGALFRARLPRHA